MKLLEINEVCGISSTGRIAVDIAKEYEANGWDVKIGYGRSGDVPEEAKKYAIRIGNKMDVIANALAARAFDNEGFNAKQQTVKFLKWADEYNPDLLWMHNLHGYYINVELLFDWIKKKEKLKVYWTLHDCWAFTGHCAGFTMNNCYKWEYGCEKCQFHTYYPKAFIDNSEKNYERKRKLFVGVNDLTIITPSNWLGNLVSRSFLKEYKIKVIPNKIDQTIFKPTKSDFREKHGIVDKKIILGVANPWSRRKGLKDFIKLSALFSGNYEIVLVGLTSRQSKNLPDNVLSIPRTNSKTELAEIYTASDVFLNLTYEDNYPTVNLEAQACGTPCITYNTGGSPESVPSDHVVETGDIEGVVRLIKQIIG